jgi:glycosyltransferase involved in cell wall biosynthesis/protein-tyrosine-phosphatase
MSADLWAGAEVQVATLTSYLAASPEIDLFVVLFNDGELAGELRRRAIPVTVIDERSNNGFQIVMALAGFFKAHRINLVHTHRYKDNLLGILAAKLARVPRVVRTIHGLMEPMRGWRHAKYRVFETIDRLALWHFGDIVIAVSRHTANALKASGYRPSSIRCIHNGVDLSGVRGVRDRDEVRRELGLATDAILIGTVGRLTEVKAQDDFLRAAVSILEQQPAARFLIVGDGPLESGLRRLTAELGLTRQVVFAGGRSDVFDLTAAMDVFVLPSLAEGMPMALLEAMTLGTPVVATAVGGVPEIVTHRSSGLLVPPRDPRALASACLEATDGQLARLMCAGARQVVAAGFSRETNGGKVMEAYRAIAPPTSSEAGTAMRPGVLGLSSSLVRGLFAYASRRCTEAVEQEIERRKVRKLRRNPTRLTAALRSARRLLIVCHGNIIRSPFAARLVAQALHDHGRVSVLSAGLGAVAGCPPHPTAALIATARSVDLSGHAASPLAAETVAASDVIFVMDVPQLLAMHDRFPEARDRTFLLTSLAAGTPLEIADPVDGDESRFQRCFDHISTAVRPIVHALCSAPGLQ